MNKKSDDKVVHLLYKFETKFIYYFDLISIIIVSLVFPRTLCCLSLYSYLYLDLILK